MKFKSQVYTQASGSIGGLTYSHNQGGMYTRARSIPTDPSSAQQLAVRNAVAQLIARWRGFISASQRAAWEVFAFNTPVINSFGDSVLISGQSWYLKANVIRRQSSLAPVDDAPVVFGAADLTTPTVVVTAATDIASVTFDNTDEWATAIGGHLFVYTSRPQNVSINFFKGPYRLAGRINGAVVPPTSPAAIALAFPVAAAGVIFLRFVAVNANGQVSASQRLRAVAV